MLVRRVTLHFDKMQDMHSVVKEANNINTCEESNTVNVMLKSDTYYVPQNHAIIPPPFYAQVPP